MSANAGSIDYEITVDTSDLINSRRSAEGFNDSFNNGMERSSQRVDHFEGRIKSLAKTMAGLFAVNQISSYVTSIAEAIDKQKKFSDRLGVSYEGLQRLHFAAAQTGVEADTLNVALQRMSRRLETVAQGAAPQVAKQLDLIGISISDIEKLDPETQFLRIADGIKNLGSDAERTRAAFALFDSGGVGLVNTLRLGSDGINDLSSQLDKLGGVISTEVATNVELFNTHMGHLSQTIDVTKENIALSLLPSVLRVSEAISDFVQDSDKLEKALHGIGVAAYATATIIIAKMVAAVGTYIGAQIASTSATIAATAALTTQGGVMTVAHVRTLALAGATRVLGASMALLGGPVGVIFLASTALVAFAYNSANAKRSTYDLEMQVDSLTDSYKKLSSAELLSSISKIKDRMSDLYKQQEKIRNTSKDGFIDFANAQSDIKKLQDEIDHLNLELGLKLRIDTEAKNADNLVNDIKNQIKHAFEKDPVELSVDNFVDFYDSAAFESLDSSIEKVRAKEEEALRYLDELYSQMPQFAEQYEIAKTNIIKIYTKQRTEILEEEAKQKQAASDKEAEREKRDAAERKRALEASIRERKTWIDRYKSVLEENERNLADSSELININERKAIKEMDEILKTGVINRQQYNDAILDIQTNFNNQRKELNDIEVKNEEDKNKKLKDELERQAEKQQQADKAFSDKANSLVSRTPLEQIAERERIAAEELKEIYEESTAPFEEYQAALTDLQTMYQEERANLLEQERQQMHNNASLILGSISSTLSGFSDIIANTSSENSKSYKAMFALSKGFAVAQAGLNLSLAISNAMASGPFPWNLGAMASVAAAGASVVGAVASATYSGARVNGGDVSGGNMYQVNESGRPEIISYGNKDYLMASGNAKITPATQVDGAGGSSGGSVTVTINNHSNAQATYSQGLTKNDVIIMIKETVPSEISDPNSRTSRALQSSTNAGRVLT